MPILIRDAVREDVPAMFELIKELALFEKAPEQVTNTVEQMYEDGFEENPIFEALISELDGQTVGVAIFYYRYSTWKGKRLYLDDLIISETARGRGLGEKLLTAVIERARQKACTGLMWQVLDWNEPGINFYKKFGARFDDEWVNVHIDL